MAAGRRPGATDSRGEILTAARTAFADRGYDGASLRSIAAAAGVDPALVHHFFGSKHGLFVAATDLPADPADLLDAAVPGDPGQLGARVLRVFLGVWDDPLGRVPLLALVRAAVSHEHSAELLRGFLGDAVLGRLRPAVRAPDAELRVALVGSQLAGLVLARYVLRLEPLASLPAEQVVATVAPTLQRYLFAADLDG